MIDKLLTPGELSAAMQAADEWVHTAIRAVRYAADPNPWRDKTDDEIAAEILRQIEVRKPTTTSSRGAVG